jgi:hypothetical protein
VICYYEDKEAPNDYTNLCGSGGDPTDRIGVEYGSCSTMKNEVTCPKCLALLNKGNVTPPSTPSDDLAVETLKSYARQAVLAERERCVKVMVAFFGGGEQAYPLVEALARAIREEK